MPRARAASHWPRSIETIPPLHTSAKNAEDWMESVITAAWKESMRAPIKIGNAKKHQNNWTSGGVLRKNSMNTLAGSDTARTRDMRMRATARPRGRPRASDAPVTLSVPSRPQSNRWEFRQTTEKSHRYSMRQGTTIWATARGGWPGPWLD